MKAFLRRYSNSYSWKSLKQIDIACTNQPINVDDELIVYSTDFGVAKSGIVKYSMNDQQFITYEYPTFIKPKYHSYCKYKHYIYIINNDATVFVFNLNADSVENRFTVKEPVNKNEIKIGKYSSCINIDGTDVIHILGGIDNEYHLLYSILQNKYIRKNYLGTKFENPAILYLPDAQQILLFCGYTSEYFFVGKIENNKHSSVDVHWEQSNVLKVPNKLRDFGYIFHKNHIIIFGGCGNNKQYSNTIYTINLLNAYGYTMSFNSIRCPEKDIYHAVLINNEIHLFGLYNDLNHYSIQLETINSQLPHFDDIIVNNIVDETDKKVSRYDSDEKDDQKSDDKDNSANTPKVIRNPYVIIVGITDYNILPCLPAVKSDIVNMKDLWINKYKYKHISCASDKDNIGSTYITENQLDEYLNDLTHEIYTANKKDKLDIDGLIFIYSGHGGNFGRNRENFVVTSEGNTGIPLAEIQAKFTVCNCLKKKPKIFYMDCCRGTQVVKDVERASKGQQQKYSSSETDIFVHFATSPNHESYTNDEKTESNLCAAISQCYIERYNEYKDLLMTLQDTGLAINSIINDKSKGKQTGEFANRLTYNVFITPYSSRSKKPQTREILLKQINDQKQMIEELESKLKQYKCQQLAT
eukprot:233469_1